MQMLAKELRHGGELFAVHISLGDKKDEQVPKELQEIIQEYDNIFVESC